MKSRDLLLASTAAGVVLGGLSWWLVRKITAVGEVCPIRLGEAFPTLTGATLDGLPLTVPDDLVGQVGLLIMADNYAARFQVTEWADYVMSHVGDHPGFAYYQVALISGIGTVMRRVIDAAMVRGTPPAVQSHVLTVYGDLRAVRGQLEMTGAPQAYLVLLGRTGRIAWRTEGALTKAHRHALDEALASHGIVGVTPDYQAG